MSDQEPKVSVIFSLETNESVSEMFISNVVAGIRRVFHVEVYWNAAAEQFETLRDDLTSLDLQNLTNYIWTIRRFIDHGLIAQEKSLQAVSVPHPLSDFILLSKAPSEASQKLGQFVTPDPWDDTAKYEP